MITPSNKLSNFGEYFFAKANKQIKEVEDRTGIKVINLGAGSPDLPPQKEVIEKFKEELDVNSNHKYPSYVGDAGLRKSIADYYRKRFGVEINFENEVLPLVGSKEGLINAMLAFLNKGEKVLVPNPCYPAYTASVQIAEGEIVEYELLEENNFLPNMEEISKMNLEGVKVWWLGYPNNPTGATATLEDMKKWVDFAKERNIAIFYDNPYADIFFEDEKPHSILEIEGAKDISIEFNSLSKTYNLAGWRIGMALSSAENISNFVKLKSNIDTGIFTAIQKASAFAIDTLDENWIKERNDIYKKRRDILVSGLKNLGFKLESPKAALYVWAKVPENFINKNVENLSLEILQKTGVFITPGTVYGSAGKGFLRISLCQNEESIAEAVKKLGEYFN